MQYIASCSFGKDSVATILLALMHNEPLDFAVFSEVMFDAKNGISGELPEHIEWVKNVAIPKLEKLGCPVKVLTHSDYLEQFYHVVTKGKYEGKVRGFPLGGKCVINRECKLKPIRDFFRNNPDVVQYVGIAIDEPQRLKRMRKKKNRISLLEKYGYTEAMAKELAENHGLLSPIYASTRRSGCWFCPSRSIGEFCKLRVRHPELWNRLKGLAETPNLVSQGFKWGLPFWAVEEKIDMHIKKSRKVCPEQHQRFTL